ncbi:winged helix-turn-helix domain-containing protein [Novispirillum sp. DQ9]|uniref:winged helix-turn-helix domain-containing protein n=1 Tax=Novispirillum sp. DQ9 TaxID=3398612 RepID=UPI003C7D5054
MSPGPRRRVVVVDPDSARRKALLEVLHRDGHDLVAADSAAALQRILADRPVDAVVLEMALPDDTGLSVLRSLRAASAVGLIALSDSTDPLDRLIALEMGADHHVSRPVEPREIAVRLRNLLWRLGSPAAGAAPAGAGKTQFRFGDWLFDVPKRVLRSPTQGTSTLTRQETAVLQALVTHAGKVLSRDQLMDAVNREWNPTDRTIDVLIGRLRRKIEADAAAPELIVTIYGEGYLFTATVL